MSTKQLQGATNDQTDIGVFIEWRESNMFPRLHSNVYRDPADGVRYQANTLTALDRGHVYRYRLTQVGALVHMPLRVMDDETWAVLKNFSSFSPRPPLFKAVTSKTPKSRAEHPFYAWRDFFLNTEDFGAFKADATERGWKLLRGVIDVDQVVAFLGKLEEDLSKWVADYKRLHALSLPGGLEGPFPQNAWEELSSLEDRLASNSLDRRTFAIDRAKWQIELAAAEQLRIAPVVQRVEDLSREVLTLSIQTLNDDLKNVAAGRAVLPVADANYLARVLNELREQYPVLRILSYDPGMNSLRIAHGGGEINYDGITLKVVSPFTTSFKPIVPEVAGGLTKLRKLT